MWYLTRASGLVALVLLTLSVAIGVVIKQAWQSRMWPRFVTQEVHRNLSLVALVFLVLHIATTVVDGFAPIGWIDAVVPFHSPYRPLWLSLGAIATDLVLAVTITSLLRRHLSYRVWRGVHWTSWAMWPIAVLHGLGTGSDTTNGWSQLVYLACFGVVLFACWWRIAAGWPAHRQGSRLAAALASVVVPLVVLLWAVGGPLQPGWAHKAGTPASILGSTPTSTP
jgi:sulfoxide reductase heme-binding subunit YedZ